MFDKNISDNGRTYFRKILPNKCHLILEKIPSFFTTSIGVWVQIGSKHEKYDQKGISHLVEHLLFRGTQTRSSADIASYIESVGGKIDACTEREMTCYSVRVLKKDVLRGIELLYDLISKPSFSEEDIIKEKDIILREIDENEEDYHLKAHDLLISNMFPSSIGYPIYGDKEIIGLIDKKQIEQYYKEYYISQNIIISIAGNFEETEVEQMVEKTFGSLPYQQKTLPEVIVPEIKKSMVLHQQQTEQAYFCFGVEGFKQTEDDRVAMYIISSILGEGMTSRLFKKVREEEGLAYTIYSYYTLYAETGAFIITGIANNGDLDKVLKIIKGELVDICNKPVPQDELNMAKAKLKGNYFFNLESVENSMIRIAKLFHWHNRHFTIDEELQMLENVSLTDVKRVAAKLFDHEKWNVSIIGNNLNTFEKEILIWKEGTGM